MKKTISIFLAMVMCVGLCACGAGQPDAVQEETKVDVTNITMSKSRLELEPGESISLTATVFPDNATDKNITWQSGNESVATVVNGYVYAVGDGNKDIFATATNGIFAKCTVTVTTPSAYSKLNADEKGVFDALINNLSYFVNPASVKILAVKNHSWDAYDYKYFATVSASNEMGGTVSKNVGFSKNGIGGFTNSITIQTDNCFNTAKINAALDEYFGR